MASLPTTNELASLRKRVTQDSQSGDDVTHLLSDLRNQAQEELEKPDCSADVVFRLFEELWAEVAKLPTFGGAASEVLADNEIVRVGINRN